MRQLIIGCLWLATPLFAQQLAGSLEFDVPFAFYVGDSSLPAGQYSISIPSQGIVLVQSTDATGSFLKRECPSAIRIVMMAPASREPDQPNRIVFKKYGEDRYFASEIWSRENGMLLPKSRKERELITSKLVASNMPETITITARVK
jgi:hypothetical protein